MGIFLKIPALIWLFISAIFFAGGEYLSKIWALGPSIPILIFVLIIYSLGVLFWLPALLHKNQLAIMGTIWTMLGTLATVLIGILIFHEKLTLIQWLGVALAFLSLFLLGA